MPKKNPRKWNWTRSIRTEIRKVARKLKKSEKNASRAQQKAIELKIELLKGCYKKLGNVRFP